MEYCAPIQPSSHEPFSITMCPGCRQILLLSTIVIPQERNGKPCNDVEPFYVCSNRCAQKHLTELSSSYPL